MKKVRPETYARIQYQVLNNLLRKDLWTDTYAPVPKVIRNVPGHEKGAAKFVVKDLAKKGLLLYHKAHDCICLNGKMKKEIIECIAKLPKRDFGKV